MGCKTVPPVHNYVKFLTDYEGEVAKLVNPVPIRVGCVHKRLSSLGTFVLSSKLSDWRA